MAAKRGRPKPGEECIEPLTRIERQASGMGLADMFNDLPTACDIGAKKNSKGYKKSAGQATNYTLMWRMAAFRFVQY